MRLIISDIDWDYPGKDDGGECPLPSEVVIEDPALILYLSDDIDGEAENIAEYLSDTYGCCVCGFTTDVEVVDGDD